MDGSRGSPIDAGLGGFGTIGSGSVGTGQGLVITGIGMVGTGIGTGSSDAGGSVGTAMGDNFHKDPRL